ncbi:tumor necrosis factor receptor superfamily member 5 [Anguilla anguilla]|uniref:tumor necrosis factor receptor superfamily member 5 n=1 Tax=Anguilla anguilla TaxID=7936 RepID=UPI0015AB2FA9|nr:tumor necrosis factor receptor superfamily member 5 [Anguilla anguilla]
MELGRASLSSDKRPHDLKNNNYKMKTFVFNFWMACILVAANACDPDTQYEKNEVCCGMCPPGTRMSADASCEDPNCIPCGEHEYQPDYTQEKKCQLQPFCDPNMNFDQVPPDPTKRLSCTCKSGHHCSSEECLTCVPHTACKPGEGVLKTGTRSSDTVCQACEPGTFSNETSVKHCREWTKCEEKTHRIKTSGTPTSDVECEEIRPNLGLAVGLPVCILLIAVAVAVVVAVVFYRSKKDRNYLKNIFKKKNPGDMKHGPLMQPDEELPETLLRLEDETGPGNCQEEGPVEDEETQPCPGRDLTENHKPLRQEEGKMEHISESEEQSPNSAESVYLAKYS